MKFLNYIILSFLSLIPLNLSAEVKTRLPEDLPPFFHTEPPPVIDVCPPEGISTVTTQGLNSILYNAYGYSADIGRPNYVVGRMVANSAGWYHIYRIPTTTMADSGNHQRNESAFISIPNGKNPEGKPHPSSGPQCNGFKIFKDIDNAGPPSSTTVAPINYGGTFYLNKGDNLTSLNHFCKLQNLVGGCDSEVDRLPTDDPSWSFGHGKTTTCVEPLTTSDGALPLVNSVLFNATELCAIPVAGMTAPPTVTIPTPSIANGNFGIGTIGSPPADWIGSGENVDSVTSGTYAHEIGNQLDSTKFVLAQDSSDSNNRVLHAVPNSNGFYASHYLPNDLHKKWTDLSWRNYIYEGRFKLLPGSQSSRLFGLSVYSEFPYNPRAIGLYFTNTDSSLKLDSINYVFRPFANRPTTDNGGRFYDGPYQNDTGVTPVVGTYYKFKIEVTSPISATRPGRTFAKAKVWKEWQSEPVNYQASVGLHPQSGSGSGFVGVLGDEISGQGVYIDDVKVTHLPSIQ